MVVSLCGDYVSWVANLTESPLGQVGNLTYAVQYLCRDDSFRSALPKSKTIGGLEKGEPTARKLGGLYKLQRW
jgi:hypothetical protein